MVNEEEVVGASATAGEGAHHLHCTALYCTAPGGLVYMAVEGVPLSESGGCVMWPCCKLDDITHSPYCHSFHSVFIHTV